MRSFTPYFYETVTLIQSIRLLDVDVPWNDLNEDGVERDDDDVQVGT